MSNSVSQARDDAERVRDDIEQGLEWLFEGLRRLRRENLRLLEENRRLHEKMAHGCPHPRVKAPAERKPSSPEVLDILLFYHELPPTFSFSRFFELADEQGMSGQVAKKRLLRFISSGMLVHRGSRIAKPSHQEALRGAT